MHAFESEMRLADSTDNTAEPVANRLHHIFFSDHEFTQDLTFRDIPVDVEVGFLDGKQLDEVGLRRSLGAGPVLCALAFNTEGAVVAAVAFPEGVAKSTNNGNPDRWSVRHQIGIDLIRENMQRGISGGRDSV